jgi:hypothetical protein
MALVCGSASIALLVKGGHGTICTAVVALPAASNVFSAVLFNYRIKSSHEFRKVDSGKKWRKSCGTRTNILLEGELEGQSVTPLHVVWTPRPETG